MVFALGSVFFLNAIFGDKGLLAILGAKRQYEELGAKLSKTRVENARLREQTRHLREDPGTIEEVARRDLGLIKQGEKLFIIRDASASHPEPQRPGSLDEKVGSN